MLLFVIVTTSETKSAATGNQQLWFPVASNRKDCTGNVQSFTETELNVLSSSSKAIHLKSLLRCRSLVQTRYEDTSQVIRLYVHV